AGSIASRFREVATFAQGVQEINRWIDNGIQEYKELGALLRSVGGILKSIGTAFSSVSVNITGTFGQAAWELDQFLASAQGKDILKEFARTVGTLANTFRQVLRTALRVLAPVIQNLAAIMP